MKTLSGLLIKKNEKFVHKQTNEVIHNAKLLQSLFPRIVTTPDTTPQDWDSAYLLLLAKELEHRGFIIPTTALENEQKYHNLQSPLKPTRAGALKSTPSKLAAVPADAEWIFVGVPSDLGSSKSGARFGPEIIRDRSRSIIFRSEGADGLFSLKEKKFPLAGKKIFDIGNIALERATVDDWLASVTKTAESLPDNSKIFLIGGDHTFSLPAILSARKRTGKPITVVHFDSHLDLQTWGAIEDEKPLLESPIHSNFMSHVLSAAPDTTLYQIGVRNHQSLPTDSREIISKYITDHSNIFTDEDFYHRDPLKFLSAIPSDANIYISIDIDCIAGPYAPATGHPASLGMTPRDLISCLLYLRKNHNIVGADVMEVSQHHDTAGQARTAEISVGAILAILGAT